MTEAVNNAIGSTAALRGLDTLFSLLGNQLGIHCSELTVRRVARSDVLNRENWPDLVARIANATGIATSSHAAAPATLHALVDPHAPLVTYVAPKSGSPYWVVVSARKGRFFDVAIAVTSEVRQKRMKLGELTELLQPAAADNSVTWVICEAALPLDPLRQTSALGTEKRSPAMRRLFSLLRIERDALWSVVVYAAFAGLLTLATPLAVQALVNTIAFGTVLQPLLVLTIALLFVLGLAGAMLVLKGIVVEYLQRRFFVRAVADLSNRLPRISFATHDKYYAPELVNRFFDVVTVQKAASTILLEGLEVFLTSTIGMIILTFYHPVLLAFSIVMFLLLIGIVYIGSRGATDTSIAESNAKYSVAAWLEDIVRNPYPFKSLGGTRLAVDRADELARGYLNARTDHFRCLLRHIIGFVALQAIASAALLGLGGWLVMRGQLTLGQLVAAELIVTVVVTSIAKFGKHFESFYDLTAALDKLGKLVDLPLERIGGERFLPEAHGASLKIEGVSYSPSGRAGFLSGLTLDIQPGEAVAIIGSSGSGKSTLLDLLFGLREPSKGTIFLDGLDLNGIDLAELRDHVVLLRRIQSFGLPIADHLRLSNPDLTPQDLVNILEQVGLYEEVARLPRGINTPLTAEGKPLSRGQLQRLTFAQAIARKPRLILVDGLLDQIPMVDRAMVLNALYSPSRPWTLVVVSTSDQVLQRCQRIINLDTGAEEKSRC